MRRTCDWRPGQRVMVSNGQQRVRGRIENVMVFVRDRTGLETEICTVFLDHPVEGRASVPAYSRDCREMDRRTNPPLPIGNAWFVLGPEDPSDTIASERNVVDFKFGLGDGLWVRHQSVEDELGPGNKNTEMELRWYPGIVEMMTWYRVGRGIYRNRYKVRLQRGMLPETKADFARRRQVMPAELIGDTKSIDVEEADAISTNDPAPAEAVFGAGSDENTLEADPAPQATVAPEPAPAPALETDEPELVAAATDDLPAKRGPSRPPKYVPSE